MENFTLWRPVQAVLPDVRNILCVGRNYRDHASELGNSVPTEPMIFGKFTHALAAAAGTVLLPPQRSVVHHELEIVLYIDKPAAAGSRAEEVVGAIALGLDLTDREAQSRLKEKGHPWEFAKSFVRSAILSDFYRFDTFDDVQRSTFELLVNGSSRQVGEPRDMVFSFDTLIDYCARHFGLRPGDILFTGTPAGVGPLKAGDDVVMRLNGEDIALFQMGQANIEGVLE
ncbi:fumarylacetoacetate hydrolase family protein [Alicyclobacillus acidiphilus]|uniref:fumarylacetoacetate hydrolase family protein n=1 Tax=Alicyclobacillus acidiphilus TaxID=182455 RepID=UPI00278BD060|nr:fumarylacetoacetate hydrolase family protein [Alicyclobacillus acidiphilus]